MSQVNEDKATRYRRLRRRSGVLTASVWATLLVGVLISGLSKALADGAAALTIRVGVPPAAAPSVGVAVFAFVLALVGAGATLPLTWHAEFVLERRFGLSRRGMADWLRGQTQTTAAHLFVWTTGAVLVYGAMYRWPDLWWLVMGPVFGVVTLALTHLAPVVTLPRLYRLRPLRRPDLQARLETLVRRVGAPVSAIHEWQLGADTTRPNAALVGIGRTLQVLLTDTLLNDYSDDEIEVVVAHELGHYVHRDMWTTLAFETVTATMACGAAHWALHWVGPLLRVSGTTGVAGLPVAILAAAVVVLTLTPLANAISRRHERRADRYALVVTGKPEALVSGLRRLSEQALAEECPSRLVEWLFYTHPPLAARLGAAREAMVVRPETFVQES